MIGALPEYLTVGDEDHRLRSDYRDVLQVFEAFSDPELEKGEKCIVAIYLLLEPFTCAEDVYEATEKGFDVNEAIEKIKWFICAGEKAEKETLPTYSWVKDEQMIFSAVNKVAGTETREAAYIHWWTFLGYFNEIGEGNFSYIVGIRHKLNEHKKLDKQEHEFYKNNTELVKLEPPKTKEELAEKAERQAILDEVL